MLGTPAMFSMKIGLAFPYTKGLLSLSLALRLSLIRNLQINLSILKFVQRGSMGIK